ncbi:alpha/beta fold hydrolase [Chryseobacterium sp. A321]
MLHFTQHGEGPQTLVLLHGFMESTAIWQLMSPFLSKEFTVVSIDLPGHGDSQPLHEVNFMDKMAKDVMEVLIHLQRKRVHLLGHSMGGYAALAFAELYPQSLKSLTLFFSSYFEDSEDKKDQRARSLRIISENFKSYANAGIPPLFSQFELKALSGPIQLAKEVALATPVEGVLASVKGMMERPNRKAVIEELDCKIMFVLGRHDQAIESDKLYKDLPQKANIKAYVLDCGHNGHLEIPEVCAQVINHELLTNTAIAP